MAHLGSPKCFGQFCGQRTGADGHLVGEKPGLTRARVRAGGSHRLDDAQGPGASDDSVPSLVQPCLAPWAVSLGSGHLPWAPGRERAVPRQEAGRHGAVPAHLGSAWWLAGTEQWTAFGLSSASPARRLRGRAVNANSLEAGSGGREARAHSLSSVPTTAQ